MEKFEKRRLRLKIGVAVLVFSMVATGVWLTQLSAAADRLDVAWSERLPLKSFQLANSDSGNSIVAGPVGKKFVGIYKTKAGELVWRYSLDLFSSEKVVSAVSVSADGKTIAAATVNGRIFLFDQFANRTGEIGTKGQVMALYLSPDGKQLAQTTKKGGVYKGSIESNDYQNIYQTDKGERVLDVKLGGNDDQIMLVTSERLLQQDADGKTIWEVPAAVKSASFDQNHSVIAVIDQSGELNVYDDEGTLSWTHQTDQVKPVFESAAVSPSGDFIAASAGEEIFLFRQTNQLINIYNPGNLASGRGKLFFTDGGEKLVNTAQGVFSSLLIADAQRRLAEYKRASGFAYPALGLIILLLIGSTGVLAKLKRHQHFGRLTHLPELIENEHKKVA